MVAWWSIRNPQERAKAKAADSKSLAEREGLKALAGEAGIKEVTFDGRTGFANRVGAFWEFSTKEERRIVRLLAEAGLYPSPHLEIVVEPTPSLRGIRSGTVYNLPTDLHAVIRAYYKSAATSEGRTRAKRQP